MVFVSPCGQTSLESKVPAVEFWITKYVHGICTVCVCVCLCEREREGGGRTGMHVVLYVHLPNFNTRVCCFGYNELWTVPLYACA
jgi:hypothetical protein